MPAKRRRQPVEAPAEDIVFDVGAPGSKRIRVYFVDEANDMDVENLRAALRGILDEVDGPYVMMPITRSGPVLPKPATPTRIGAIKVAEDAAQVYDVRPKLDNAIRVLGNNTVADLLGVSRSQPGRWSRGEEGIAPENQAMLLDLDFVLSVLLRTMTSDLAGIWLVSPNAFLNGARPVDMFRLEGHRRVVEAIQAYAEGAFA